ncbi:hypothetical protein J1N35_006925 [Gossypium stocksii]|uniref:Uncharacterized protein n=1 Tax=Gossypium stocksii TaxID=47602 RepID=A0A9D4ACZ7_9ROSI|nr:hypothetical protein J1N35_006925 [Gossypium stocksii]
MKREFIRMYGYEELGQRLKELRPPEKEGGFSLQELNERLLKLRAIEDKEAEVWRSGVFSMDIRVKSRMRGGMRMISSKEEKENWESDLVVEVIVFGGDLSN